MPASDRGNENYRDHGLLGSYTPTREPRGTPEDVKMFTGYGADESVLERGYCDPAIREDPAYDKDNYVNRSMLPMADDGDEGGDDLSMNDDYAFQRRNERSRGFLTRPRLPTDR